MRRTIDQLLAEARSRLARLDPVRAAAAMREGAVLVDTRPLEQREADGEVPGALVIGRNVLEWRLDPASEWRLPLPGGHDLHVIVMCDEGYSSSLAAATLHMLGMRRATDLVGGFRAWAAAGLPVVPRLRRAARVAASDDRG